MFNFIEIEFKNELASYAIRISPVFFEQRSSSINSHGSKTSAERIETSVTGNQAILPSASEKSERSRGDGASFPQFIFWVFQKVKKKKNGKKVTWVLTLWVVVGCKQVWRFIFAIFLFKFS
jgi:hypothetical protein